MRVFTYFNLHKKCWSIKALEGEFKGRVIAHAKRVILKDCTFKVSEAGRQRVLRTKRKNVHAGVVGTMYSAECFVAHDATPRFGQGSITQEDYDRIIAYIEAECVRVTYNPYKYEAFVAAEADHMQVKTAATCYINERGVFAKNVVYYVPAFDSRLQGSRSPTPKAPDNKHRVRVKQLLEK